MVTSTTSSLRRLASTLFVFLALFVACAGASATAHGEPASCLADVHATVAADEVADMDDEGSLPFLEDNGGGVDDTFDVPVLHAVTVSRHPCAHPGELAAGPHAHHANLDLRPPIA